MLQGCAVDVPYKKYGDSPFWAAGVGYNDFEIVKDKYKVSYVGGVYDSPNKVMKFTYQRAKELCKELGSNDYIISNTDSGNQLAGIQSAPSFGGDSYDTKNQSIYTLDIECKKN